MKHRTALAGPFLAAIVSSATASPVAAEPLHVDRDSRPCVSHNEWVNLNQRLGNGHHPPAWRVEDEWEVAGLQWDAVVDLGHGVQMESVAFPRCRYVDRPEDGWYGFVVDEQAHVFTVTKWKREADFHPGSGSRG